MEIIGSPAAIKRDPHLHTSCGEQIAEFLAQLDTVSVDTQIEFAHTSYLGAQRAYDARKAGHARKQRLAAVKYDVDLIK